MHSVIDRIPSPIIILIGAAILVVAFTYALGSTPVEPMAPPAPQAHCVDVPMRTGLGWEPWELVEVCE